MHRSHLARLRTPLTRRLRPLAYTLVALLALLLFFTWVALQAQVALASFLNADTLWLKSQTQATVHLLNYVAAGKPAERAAFERDLAVLTTFRRAREKVLSGDFRYQAVTADLRHGGAAVLATPSALFVFDHFAWAPYVKQAIATWRLSDAPVDELRSIAREVRQTWATGSVPSAERARLRARVTVLNDFIASNNQRFSTLIAKGALLAGTALFAAIVALAAAAITLWLLMARRVVRRAHGEEERYRLLFDSAPDAIVMLEAGTGCILDANRTACAWAGGDPQTLLGSTYPDLLARSGLRELLPGSNELPLDAEQARPVETQTGTLTWGGQLVRQAIIRDVSERVESSRARRVAAAALANITEGVLIADARRRVVSANVAAVQIMGFTEDALLGTRLEATRCLPDGRPLPETIWEDASGCRHWSGEVVSRRHDGTTYPERLTISSIRDARQVRYYVAVFSDVSDARAIHDRLERLALHDALTGLVNRAEFQRRCDVAFERAAREHTVAAVAFVDLDGFKGVNDGHGHAVGDEVLTLAAQRIRHQLREGDIAGRIGGDEFAVLLTGLASSEEAAAWAGRVLPVLSSPFRVGDAEVAISASIGIAGFPADGCDAQALVAAADAAMYVAKRGGRNTWRLYAPEMRDGAQERSLLTKELRRAVAEGEFRLVYQPIVDMRSRQTVSAEALLRWQHPERGEIPPDAFIPAAERAGVIRQIDEWVLNTVCAQVHAWDASGVPRIRVSVNVSASWFGHPGFLRSVDHALRTNAVAPGRIVLEITEGTMLQLGPATQDTLEALHGMGMGVAIDDFGTGYASMACLKLPAVDFLKIDRSFVAGLPDNTSDAVITSAVLAMAQRLGPTVIAEGIENDAQHRCLLDAGCTRGQGFLYSRPLSPVALAAALATCTRSRAQCA